MQRQHIPGLLLAATLLTAAPSLVLAQVPLQSPWDMTSPGHGSADGANTCPTPVNVGPDLDAKGFYKHNGHGDTPDPKRLRALKKKTASIVESKTETLSIADKYQSTGEDQYARCSAEWLSALAKENALTGELKNSQSHFIQAWTLGIYSIAWLKIRNSPAITGAQREAIPAWLHTLGTQNRAYWQKRESNSGNIYYSGGLGSVAAGIATNDRSLYDWGIGVFDDALNNITSDGYIKQELTRGKKALSYSTLNATLLVALAELAAANGDNLYAHKNYVFVDYMNHMLQALLDPADISKVVGKQQKLRKDQKIGWIPNYVDSFPSENGHEVVEKYNENGPEYAKMGGQPPTAFIHTGVMLPVK